MGALDDLTSPVKDAEKPSFKDAAKALFTDASKPPFKWETVGASVPQHTYVAGRMLERECVGVSRAIMEDGVLTGGKFWIRNKEATIPWEGYEYPEENCQVLCVTPDAEAQLDWVAATYGSVPPGAVTVGTNLDGDTQYVARVEHFDSVIPGYVVPKDKCCYYGVMWKQLQSSEYEVLVVKSVRAGEPEGEKKLPLPEPIDEPASEEEEEVPAVEERALELTPEDIAEPVKWVSLRDADPESIIITGEIVGGESFGIARGQMPRGEMTGGKIVMDATEATLPWYGKDHVRDECQVLVVKPENEHLFKWMSGSDGNVPHGAVVAGNNEDGTEQYVGRVWHEGNIVPGKIVPIHKCCYFGWEGRESNHKQYEVLVSETLPSDDDAHEWVTLVAGSFPEHAFEGGRLQVPGDFASARTKMPNGAMSIGKVWTNDNTATFPWYGRDRVRRKCEVLTASPAVRSKLEWVAVDDGSLPDGAIPVGGEDDGKPAQFVGRVRHNGHVIPGKVIPKHGKCYFGFESAERNVEEYEMLVFNPEKEEDKEEASEKEDDDDEFFSGMEGLSEEGSDGEGGSGTDEYPSEPEDDALGPPVRYY